MSEVSIQISPISKYNYQLTVEMIPVDLKILEDLKGQVLHKVVSLRIFGLNIT
jgi:hypothetical protein